MQLTSDGRIVSSGKGLAGLLAAWRSMANVFTIELPRLLAALGRIAR